MDKEPSTSETEEQSWWERLSDWLGLDKSAPVDMLTTDPARHFREWDRDLPDRHAG